MVGVSGAYCSYDRRPISTSGSPAPRSRATSGHAESMMPRSAVFVTLPHVTQTICGGGPRRSSNRTKSSSFVTTTPAPRRRSPNRPRPPVQRQSGAARSHHARESAKRQTRGVLAHRSKRCGARHRSLPPTSTSTPRRWDGRAFGRRTTSRRRYRRPQGTENLQVSAGATRQPPTSPTHQ